MCSTFHNKFNYLYLGYDQCVPQGAPPSSTTCPRGYVQWNVTNNYLASEANYIIWAYMSVGMSVTWCQDFCFKTPGCVTAWMDNGDCILMPSKVPRSGSAARTYIEYECCGECHLCLG